MALLSGRQIARMVETANQLANATMVEIAEPGPLEPNGDAGAPSPVWAGEARCHLSRDQIAVVRDGAETQEDIDVVRIFDGSGAPVDFVRGPDWSATSVVIDDERRAEPIRQRWTVVGVDRDADGTLDSVRLILDNPKEAP